jgi:hypothetical protein
MTAILALVGMDADVSKFFCSFYKVKTTRCKNDRRSFLHQGCAPSSKLLTFSSISIFLCNNVKAANSPKQIKAQKQSEIQKLINKKLDFQPTFAFPNSTQRGARGNR